MRICSGRQVLGSMLSWVLCVPLLLGLVDTARSAGKLVVEEGAQVHGLASGITFGQARGFTVDELGRVVHVNVLRGPGATRGLFIDNMLVARVGDPVPGLPPGSTFTWFPEYQLWNSSGRLIFGSSVTGPSGSFGAVFQDNDLVLRTGIPLPGLPTGAVVDGYAGPQVNASGQLGFAGSLSGPGFFPGNQDIVYSNGTVIARAGQQMPGLPTGTTFLTFAVTTKALNDAGQIAYLGVPSPGGGNRAVYRDTTLLAASGMQVPGLAPGIVFGELEAPRINQSGTVAYRSPLFGPSGTGGGTAIFRDQTIVAYTGGAVPGLPGVVYSGFQQFLGPDINDAGQIAFVANLSGPGVTSNNQAIFRDDTLIARKGASTASGWVIGEIERFTGALLSSNGFVSFLSDVTSSNGLRSGRALWVGDGNELVDMVLPGDFIGGKQVIGILGSSTDTALNQRGQAAFTTNFQTISGTSFDLVLYAPNLYWRGAPTGEWTDSRNWSFGFRPSETYGARILTPGSYVLGPLTDETVSLLQIGGEAGSSTLELRGDTKLIVLNGPVQIKAGGVLTGSGAVNTRVVNVGTIVVQNLTLTEGLANGGLVHGNGTLIAALQNNTAGRISTHAGQYLRVVGTAHSNLGQLTIGNGSTQEYTGVLTNAAVGRIEVAHGALRLNDGLLNYGQIQLEGTGATLYGNIETPSGGKIAVSSGSVARFFGAIDIAKGAELHVSTGAIATFFDKVQQHTGSLFSGDGTKHYEGGLSVGNSPGLGEDAGSVRFGVGNTYIAEIGGTAVGDDLGNGLEFDRYVVAGMLSFGGSLKLVLWNGVSATAGDRFDLFDWGMSEGQFNSIDYTAAPLGAGLIWDISELYATGTIAVAAVPEPGQWLLFFLGFGVVGYANYRKKQA
jgi:hypothetical protein